MLVSSILGQYAQSSSSSSSGASSSSTSTSDTSHHISTSTTHNPVFGNPESNPHPQIAVSDHPHHHQQQQPPMTAAAAAAAASRSSPADRERVVHSLLRLTRWTYSHSRPADESKRTLVLLFLLCAASGMIFGFTVSLGGLLDPISADLDFVNSTSHSELLNSATLVGGLAFSPVAGVMGDRLGRIWTTLLCGVLSTVASVVSAIVDDFWFLCACRFVLGIGSTVICFIVPVYVAECAPANSRGLLIAVFQLSINTGFAVSYGIQLILSWRWALGVGAAPGILVMLLVTGWLPESPRYLLSKLASFSHHQQQQQRRRSTSSSKGGRSRRPSISAPSTAALGGIVGDVQPDEAAPLLLSSSNRHDDPPVANTTTAFLHHASQAQASYSSMGHSDRLSDPSQQHQEIVSEHHHHTVGTKTGTRVKVSHEGAAASRPTRTHHTDTNSRSQRHAHDSAAASEGLAVAQSVADEEDDLSEDEHADYDDTSGLLESSRHAHASTKSARSHSIQSIGAMPDPEDPQRKTDLAAVVEEEDEIVHLTAREFFSLLSLRSVVLGFMLCILNNAIQALVSYGPQIFKAAGYSNEDGVLAGTISGGSSVILSLISMPVIHHFSRRFLVVITALGVAIGTSVIAAGFQFLDPGSKRLALLITGQALTLVAFQIGVGPLFFIVVPEIFPQRIRGAATGMFSLVLSGCSLAITITFLTSIDQFGVAVTFLYYGLMFFMSFLGVWRLLPETGNVALESIKV
ncbi:hypothetical protein CAOG_05104 [Capsaspora owczarzaki ATCC 30864]|uniref:Major facilitator superfamily (MFS) profile domain-containing protein n=1 Tax=Capsaspora owczarzaki (strain ATCC 30864) TaxID=595528 RepID=A0A0D2UH75_CAPO3|nr:hypothetical protein CAOG_05104 [Capsaspora owczarzaki ATCC 30864]KJE94466.1 hypothetical protein CAOG_005104 [Capsaspora owczarzaki ATCC 30864]|eukprot:XP_004346789.1 hypothetical protein CAOG_05104 [Capsaspora owczarzaki ATCC 30864]